MIKGNHHRIRPLILCLVSSAFLGLLVGGCFFTEEMADGGGINQLPYPEPEVETWLYSVWGRSETDVWAVGQPGLILHYDGSTWTMDTVETRALTDVWGNDDETFICGTEGAIYRLDGGAWTKMDSGTTETLSAIGEGPYGNIYAVGEHSMVLQLNGNTWDDTEPYAYRFTDECTVTDTLDFYFDLDGFSSVGPYCIAGDSAKVVMENPCWETPPPDEAGHQWRWGTVEDRHFGYIRCCYGDADTITNNYLANDLGEVLRLGRDNTFALSWLYPKDPNGYSCKPATYPAPINGIWMHPDELTIYTVTEWGSIGTLKNDCSESELLYDGDKWLSDIWGNETGTEIFVVGIDGLILHSTGGAWTLMDNVPLPE